MLRRRAAVLLTVLDYSFLIRKKTRVKVSRFPKKFKNLVATMGELIMGRRDVEKFLLADY